MHQSDMVMAMDTVGIDRIWRTMMTMIAMTPNHSSQLEATPNPEGTDTAARFQTRLRPG